MKYQLKIRTSEKSPTIGKAILRLEAVSQEDMNNLTAILKQGLEEQQRKGYIEFPLVLYDTGYDGITYNWLGHQGRKDRYGPYLTSIIRPRPIIRIEKHTTEERPKIIHSTQCDFVSSIDLLLEETV